MTFRSAFCAPGRLAAASGGGGGLGGFEPVLVVEEDEAGLLFGDAVVAGEIEGAVGVDVEAAARRAAEFVVFVEG